MSTKTLEQAQVENLQAQTALLEAQAESLSLKNDAKKAKASRRAQSNTNE